MNRPPAFRRWRSLVDPYVALMALTVALAALLPARGTGAAVAGWAADAGIVFLFFLYGARLSPAAAIGGLKQWRLQLAVLATTYGLFPVLGLLAAAIMPGNLPPELGIGLIFLGVLPSTVQSSIAFTSIARGNVPAALCAASASNLLGVVVTPALAGWLLQAGGVQLSFDIFRDILLQLLAPFILGQVARRWIGGCVERRKKLLGYADRGSILLIIYVAFSRGMVDGIWGQVRLPDLLALSAILVLLLAVALAATAGLSRALRFGREDAVVLTFCGSKKSLASGLPMASVLFAGPQLGLIVLPLMLFHQLQLVVCAILARRWADATTAAGEPA